MDEIPFFKKVIVSIKHCTHMDTIQYDPRYKQKKHYINTNGNETLRNQSNTFEDGGVIITKNPNYFRRTHLISQKRNIEISINKMRTLVISENVGYCKLSIDRTKKKVTKSNRRAEPLRT